MKKIPVIVVVSFLLLLTSCFNRSKIEIISKQDATIIINDKEYVDKEFVWLKNNTDVEYEFQKQGYDSIIKTVTITPDTTYIREDLKPSKVNLIINVDSDNTQIYLDDNLIESETNIKPGSYSLKIISDKYEDYENQIKIEIGKDKKINVTLDKSKYKEIKDKFYFHKFAPFRFISEPEANADDIGEMNPFDYCKVIGKQINKGFYHVEFNNQKGWISDYTYDDLLDWNQIEEITNEIKNYRNKLNETLTPDKKSDISKSYILENHFGELHRRFGVSWHFLDNDIFYVLDTAKTGVPSTDYGIWTINNGYLVTQFVEIDFESHNLLTKKPITWQKSNDNKQPYSDEFLISDENKYKTMHKADLELNKQFIINDYVLDPVYKAVKLKKNTSFYITPNESNEIFIFEDHYDGDKDYKVAGEQVYILGKATIDTEDWLYIDVLTDSWLSIYYINYAWIKESELEYTQSRYLNIVNEDYPYELEVEF